MSVYELLSEYGSRYVLALLTTWELTFFAAIISFVIGIVVTVMRVSPIKPLRAVSELYVQIFRNIPGASLLILLVYALPYLDVVLSYFACVLIAALVWSYSRSFI